MTDGVGFNLVQEKSISIAAGPYESGQNRTYGSQLNCAAFDLVRDASQIKWIYPLGAPIKYATKSVILKQEFCLGITLLSKPPFNCRLFEPFVF